MIDDLTAYYRYISTGETPATSVAQDSLSRACVDGPVVIASDPGGAVGRSTIVGAISGERSFENSLIFIRGPSIERLYHRSVSRPALDLDVVVRDLGAFLDVVALLKNHAYRREVCPVKGGVTRRKVRLHNTAGLHPSVEIHVGGYVDNRGASHEWPTLFGGSYRTLSFGYPIRVPSDCTTVSLLAQRVFSAPSASVRDTADFLLCLESLGSDEVIESVSFAIAEFELQGAAAKIRDLLTHVAHWYPRTTELASIADSLEW